MNFNDIELRLRYPQYFRDADDPPCTAPAPRRKTTVPADRSVPRDPAWLLALRVLFRRSA